MTSSAVTSRTPALLIDSIQAFSSCEIADALVTLECHQGGYLPDLNLYSPDERDQGLARKLCGEAFTVKMVLASDTKSPRPSEHFVDAAEEGTVIVISCPPNTRNAVWGGLMTARAQFRGVKGVVINGRCRDLAEHREAGFYVFANSHSVLGQSTFTRPSILQKPIIFNESLIETDKRIIINPHDIIIGDEDGVVVIPKALAEEVIKICSRNVEIDKKCLIDLKNGRSIKETFAEHRGR
ncbi:hypothetical protein CROQUDRAFT_67610 [Cronartium quercuum f. sp. fusiforme G11]|uniref:RraA-like protein n=1 Tax=Cronartium quercuum f. sp. fusiforme G11 TaxID=708437 RepID=A0A9P6T801_9BASI|nr:hypothetical protein CROQUDRAFT_67610 [Cronartium quercuum f. sp. fusiforme G11]